MLILFPSGPSQVLIRNPVAVLLRHRAYSKTRLGDVYMTKHITYRSLALSSKLLSEYNSIIYREKYRQLTTCSVIRRGTFRVAWTPEVPCIGLLPANRTIGRLDYLRLPAEMDEAPYFTWRMPVDSCTPVPFSVQCMFHLAKKIRNR